MAKKDKGKKKGKDKGSSNFEVLDKDLCRVRINNVRLSFPALFTPKVVGKNTDPNATPKFSGVFLLDDKEHDDTIEFFQSEGLRLAKSIGMKKLSISKSFIKPGDEKSELEGFEDTHFITASNPRRPLAIDKDKSAVTEADGLFYPGCYVNVVVQIWAQDNQWGKRVNASLEGIQFHADGESMGGGNIADEDDFS